ncbi:MAG: DUF3120 domain-containing protein [Leptolyngbya foveolarum]|uniref:DUF3120 domain-containing protein n=1 Tax=Leptolyngbya foveolarum TaxID=47253 RepID=A0A2W4W0L5_9CYAN|nr:MAG: DUF3120 domain-containing protein [Leptolyngbya foveolarum]
MLSKESANPAISVAEVATQPEATQAVAIRKVIVRPDETELSALHHLFHPQSLATFSNRSERLKVLLASAFLVAVPVFIQAPLVRVFPWLSLAITGLWLWLGWTLFNRPGQKMWGDLVIGFSWTWLAGAVYWGWFRWEPLIHLPIEAIALPIVLVLMRYGKNNTGNYFYLGSLFGTAITDIYFYCTGLIPYWRKLMISPPAEAGQILHSALLKMETYQGVGFAVVLLSLLLMLGTIPLRTQSVRWWAFSGAVLSTILVDSLFFAAAIFA